MPIREGGDSYGGDGAREFFLLFLGRAGVVFVCSLFALPEKNARSTIDAD
jgi:hypothetical protein